MGEVIDGTAHLARAAGSPAMDARRSYRRRNRSGHEHDADGEQRRSMPNAIVTIDDAGRPELRGSSDVHGHDRAQGIAASL